MHATPSRIVRILHLEDSVRDVQFVEDLLDDQGVACAITQVARRAPFEEALRTGPFDLVICDYSLPDLDGLSALRLVRASHPELPVIIVSGAIDSPTAVSCLREGATDLLLKDRLERLPSAILRALDERDRRAQLREVEERFRQMADQTPTGYWFIAPDPEEILYVNQAVSDLWGRPLAELMTQPRAFLQSVHEDDRARVAGAYAHWIRGDTPTFNEELRVRDANGAIRWIHHSGTRLLDADGQRSRLSAISQEITERKAMEAQIQHSQKLEVVGRLAGGIAHDFNTLLTVITATSELALARIDPVHPLVEDLTEIRSAGERGAALVAQLMAFSRQQILRPRVVDPGELIQNLERMILRLIGAHIRSVLVLPSTALRITVDPGQLEQVILNLVVNARDAMRGGGTLTVSLAVVTPDTELAARFGHQPCVQISVADTGIGMTDEVKRRAFEPFFTTKGSEGGTGLGLSTVYGIIEQSGGVVQMESTVGVGTTFRLLLPLVVDPPTTAGASVTVETRAVTSLLPGSGTILVVDDDHSLRHLVKRTLSAAGYTVLMADNGTAALRLLQDVSGGMDLLLTDMVMPEMSGQQLAARGRAINPALRVLFMSGYTEDEVMRQTLHDGADAFLPKPFTVASLTRGVARALGRTD